MKGEGVRTYPEMALTPHPIRLIRFARKAHGPLPKGEVPERTVLHFFAAPFLAVSLFAFGFFAALAKYAFIGSK